MFRFHDKSGITDIDHEPARFSLEIWLLVYVNN